jgi:succinyl-diaminopimelate desuccinylase
VGAHASTPELGVNGITALLEILAALPLADCASTQTIRQLVEFFPHGDGEGKALGVAQRDEISGELTLAFTLLTIHENGMNGMYDSRVPVCANEENCRKVVEEKLGAAGFEVRGFMTPPHHTPADTPFVQALLKSYEAVTGEKGECFAMGGGTYVHDVEGGVAFGAGFADFEGNPHGANEKMSIAGMLKAAKIYALSIYEICK